jgi:nitrate reductase delta subunit
MNALDSLAGLLTYPDASLARRARILAETVQASHPRVADDVECFAGLVEDRPLAELQEEYTSAFDLSAACSLELGWHLFGESRDRGAFLASIREDLQRAGVAEASGLPDHVSHLLPLLAREEPERAAMLAVLIAPAIETVRGRLGTRGSAYVHLLAAAGALAAELASRRASEGTPT